MQRKTKQREAIWACFSNEPHALTPAEVHERLARKHPSLGIATVYRTVNALVAAGELRATVIAQTTRYELASRRHHDHFLCRRCSKVYCLDACLVAHADLSPMGFSAESHDLVVSGTCRRCNESAALPERRTQRAHP